MRIQGDKTLLLFSLSYSFLSIILVLENTVGKRKKKMEINIKTSGQLTELVGTFLIYIN